MCLRPPGAARSARVERTAVKAARSGSSAGPVQLTTRLRSCSNVSTTSSSWSPTGMLTQHETVSGRWVEDAAARTCAKCERVFSLVNRRHHCRVCGEIFCHACSRTRMVLSTNPGEIPRRQRVCDPCAAHAHSSAVMYADESAFGATDSSGMPTGASRSLFRSRLSATELMEGASITEELLLSEETTSNNGVSGDGSSVSFMLASMVGFAAAFWFLKDEVAVSNPAVWILFAGFSKNLFELITRMSRDGLLSFPGGFTGGVTAIEDAEKVFSGMDLDATDDTLSTTTTTTTTTTTKTTTSKPSRYASMQITAAQSEELLASSRRALDSVLALASTDVETDSAWTVETPTTENITVHSRDGKPSRVYKCEADIPLSPDELFDELYGNFETSSTWNVTAAENNIARKLDETTDLVHLVTAPALGGMITSRDFVNTRTWRRQDGGGYVIATSYAGKSLLKPQKGVTRGENGPTGWLILPHPSSPFKSRLVWIMNCDIKGYFPSSIIRKGSISEISCFVRNLRRYIARNAAEAAPEYKMSDVQ
ncbi:hypothetical protein BBJ28_00000169 [Nothophytophthora sp. Chile5]|nr:hypothetical protein BBJ28_00000169 [Nothophytophthora sp. Chile5]